MLVHLRSLICLTLSAIYDALFPFDLEQAPSEATLVPEKWRSQRIKEEERKRVSRGQFAFVRMI